MKTNNKWFKNYMSSKILINAMKNFKTWNIDSKMLTVLIFVSQVMDDFHFLLLFASDFCNKEN